jgi:hypothetical protein
MELNEKTLKAGIRRLKKREYMREYMRELFRNNPEINRERVRRWISKNPEKHKERQREWARNNPEKCRERVRKWIRANPEKDRQHTLKYNRAIKLEVLAHYSNGVPECSCCGESRIEFLSIDHVNGGGNKHRKEIGKVHFYAWLKRNNFPLGYRVLCFNCNMAFGLFGYCPHEIEKKIVEGVKHASFIPSDLPAVS